MTKNSKPSLELRRSESQSLPDDPLSGGFGLGGGPCRTLSRIDCSVPSSARAVAMAQRMADTTAIRDHVRNISDRS